MKLSILQQDLLPALQSVSRSIGVRSSLPVLANILLQAQEGSLVLSSTNLEIGVIKKIKAQILEEGEITVPAKTIVELVSSLNSSEVELETAGEQLKVSTKNFSATINGIAATEFPSIPLASDRMVAIDGSLLQNALPQITFAAASDEGRPILTGILTEIKKDSIELVATDGFRLAHKRAPIKIDQEILFRSLIPRRTFEEVVRLISEDVGGEDSIKHIEISTSENQNQMIFKIGETQLSSRLIEGQFPSWEKIVPSTFENKTTVDRAQMLKAVKLASVFAKDSANIIKLQTEENKIKLSSEAKELGSQENEVDATVEGNPIVIAFNSKFIQDALSACNADQVVFEFSGNLSPALIKPVGEDGLEYVVMPIRLS